MTAICIYLICLPLIVASETSSILKFTHFERVMYSRIIHKILCLRNYGEIGVLRVFKIRSPFVSYTTSGV